MWIPALLALLVDDVDERRRRARLHELRNRLGLGKEKRAPSDMRTRLLWAYSQLQDLEPDRAWAIMRMLAAWLTRFTILSKRTGEQFFAETDPPGMGILLPIHGLRSRAEPLVPWLLKLARDLENAAHQLTTLPLLELGPGGWKAADRKGESLRIDTRRVAHQLPGILDWFEETAPADLLSMTWGDALRASNQWHRRFFIKARFRGPVPQGIAVMTWTDGARIDRLVTRSGLEAEGESMAHCVGGHWALVRDGDELIFSYRRPDGIPLMTWAISSFSLHFEGRPVVSKILNELQGPGNGVIDIGEQLAAARIRHWFEIMRIDLGEWQSKLGITYVLPREIFPDWMQDQLPPRAPTELKIAPGEEIRAYLRADGELGIAIGVLQTRYEDAHMLLDLDSEDPEWLEYLQATGQEEDKGVKTPQQEADHLFNFYIPNAWQRVFDAAVAEIDVLQSLGIELKEQYHPSRRAIKWTIGDIAEGEVGDDLVLHLYADNEFRYEPVYDIGGQTHSNRSALEALKSAGFIKLPSEVEETPDGSVDINKDLSQLEVTFTPKALDAIRKAKELGMPMSPQMENMIRHATKGEP